LNIAGFHYYTFNQLVDTWEWERETLARSAGLAVSTARRQEDLHHE
jgi:hypothetical protein